MVIRLKSHPRHQGNLTAKGAGGVDCWVGTFPKRQGGAEMLASEEGFLGQSSEEAPASPDPGQGEVSGVPCASLPQPSQLSHTAVPQGSTACLSQGCGAKESKKD